MEISDSQGSSALGSRSPGGSSPRLWPEENDRAETIATSWTRCRSLGLDESTRPETDLLPRAGYIESSEPTRKLIEHGLPVVETLYEQIRGTHSLVLLTDANGVIIHTLGDPDFLSRAERVVIVPGGEWSEKRRGTNAVGTAIAEHRPITVHGGEHFLAQNRFLTCSAAPISDAQGNLIGVIDVSGHYKSAQSHTLAMARMASTLVENQLFAASMHDAILVRFHTRSEFIGTLCEGVIAFRPDGQAISTNRSGSFQLGLGASCIPMHTLSSLFGQPVSQLLDHVRKRGSEPMALDMHTGIRVFAKVELGSSLTQRSWFFENVQITKPEEREAPRRGMVRGRPPAAKHRSLDDLDTGDTLMREALSKLRLVRGRNIPILIQGETGTGKEFVARAIHDGSPRREKPFVAVNCASIPETLIESELFGYAEGAFTGAHKKGALGKIMQADGGTLFLDEIGDMPLGLQARLLRVLQERVVMPLGSTAVHSVDIAIVCATNRDLKQLIAKGQFRADLYYRLNGLRVTLPPLRSRTDLWAIVQNVLQGELDAGDRIRVGEEALELFRRHAWPGNIRQLVNVLSVSVALAGTDAVIRREHLPEDFIEDLSPSPLTPLDGTNPGSQPASVRRLADMEQSSIEQALHEAGGNISAAARVLGVSRMKIYRRMK